MWQYLQSSLQSIMQTVCVTYGVDPVIFRTIYLACAPIWYFSLFRTLRALTTGRMNEVTLWSVVFLGSTVAPFLYVLVFGHNIPWWVYALIVVLVGQGVLTLVQKLRKQSDTGPLG